MPEYPSSARAPVHGLWHHVGLRIANRRAALGLSIAAVAAHVGVDPITYENYEAGHCVIPAMTLADLADLFRVPVFFIFQDLPLGSDEPALTTRNTSAELTVATPAERVAELNEQFNKLSWQEQQHVLMFVRALSSKQK